MQNDLSRRTFMGRLANTAAGVAVVSLDLTACTVDKAKTRTVTTTPAGPSAPTPTPAPVATTFKQLKVGAGGFVTGIDTSADGSTKVIRCDTFGAYKWDAKTSTWLPLLTSASMPAGEVGPDAKMTGAPGAFEVAVAPNAGHIIYVIFNGFIYRTENGGTTFARTAFAQQHLDSNDRYRINGRKLAVDSANAKVVYAGTQRAGMFRSLDGENWTTVASVPAGATDAGVLVAIDHSSALVGGRRSVVYAHSDGRGVYRSNDGGDSFALLAGSPKAASKMTCGPDGSIFIVDETLNCYRYRGGAWSASKINDWGNFHTIAVNPKDKNHLAAGGSGGSLRVSFDGGTSWLGTMTQARLAQDVPWLAWTNEDYMSSGDIAFDPANPGSLLFAQGIGVWNTNNVNGANVNWQSSSRGIEQLVTNAILSVPGGNPLMFVWDRGMFEIADPEVYPSKHQPTRSASICHGWHGDYAPNNTKFVTAVFNGFDNDNSGYSLDGGSNWNKFATIPAEVMGSMKVGGCIAAGSPDNIVWVTSNNGSPWLTQNRGASWTRVDLPGIPTTGDTGWGWAYYLNRKIVAADRVNANTFYLYNYLPNVGGVFRSTDGGKSWTRVFAGPLSTWSTFNAKLRAVPGRAGHLFFTEGNLDGANPGDSPMMRSTDGGATWSKLANVNEAHGIGFGKAQTDGGYPAVYIVGYVDKKFGVHVSYDECKSWKLLTEYAANSFDLVSCVEGDMNVFGRVFVGLSGSGAVYGSQTA